MSYDIIKPGHTRLYDSPRNELQPSDVMPHLTGQQREWLCEYIRTVADRMWLQNWTLQLCWTSPTNDNAWASVKVVNQIHVANIWFAREFWDQPPHEQRRIVAHEMVHILLHPMSRPVNEDIVKWLGQAVYEVFWDNFSDAEELAVDALSSIIAPGLPLPPWADLPTSVVAAGNRKLVAEARAPKATPRPKPGRKR